MEQIYNGAKGVLLYLIIVIFLQTVFGDKVAQNMTLMILFSMLVLNSGKVATTVSNITKNLTS